MTTPKMEQVGRVTGFFAHPSVALMELTAPLRIGETIYVKGHTTEFQQVVQSMQLDHQPVQEAAAGQAVGVQVSGRCRRHDVVYKLVV
jgi:putative protease